MDPEANPTVSKLGASVMLYHASNYIEYRTKTIERDYHDLKASQLLINLSDLLLAEVRIESWLTDLGTNGCQVA